MASILVANVSSQSSVLSGDQHNSSSDFNISNVPSNAQSFTFKVTASSGDNADAIRFNVWKDKNNWPDSILWGSSNEDGELFNGYNTTDNVEDQSNLYIGDPVGATESFIVEIYANYPG